MIKVIYDISVLGNVHFWGKGATGVPRVVNNVLQHLLASTECEVSLCAVFRAYRASEFARTDARIGPKFRLNSRADGPIGQAAISLDRQMTQLAARGSRSARIAQLTGTALLLACDPLLSALDANEVNGADIFHSPFDPLPRRSSRFRKVRRFLTIYDLVAYRYPQFLMFRQRFVIQRIVKSVRKDDLVLCISEATKNDFCEHTKHDPARAFVTPLAADPSIFYQCKDRDRQAEVRKRYGIPDNPYLLSLCTLEPRKNLGTVIKAFSQLTQEPGMGDLRLVLVGGKGWLQAGGVDAELEAMGSMRDRVILTGFVPDEDLASVYSGAIAFVYMSFYEGFGLPPLEAMQCGVPAITSNTSSLPEVVGDSGVLLAPTDCNGLCQSILKIFQDTEYRQRLAQASLERARLFSWERCAQQTISAYRTALS